MIAPFVLEVTARDFGERLDVIVARAVAREGISRAQVQLWIEAERVCVDGKPVTSRFKAKVGTKIAVAPAPPPPSTAVPQDIPIDILYEDAEVLVLAKAAGMVVHPAAGHADGTLVNAILHHAQIEEDDAEDEMSARESEGPPRPGIVHRLDKDTSGVMVVAKTLRAKNALVPQFADHSIERAYYAIVVGDPPASATYSTWHGRHPVDRKRFSGRVTSGKRAVTHMKVLERFTSKKGVVVAALVECRLETGRTHQIRVHLSEAGFPLLSDPLYGKPPKNKWLAMVATAMGRQALHAWVLGFRHPQSGELVRFEQPLPNDFAEALTTLRQGEK